MRYGFVLPGGTATQQLEQAVLAEERGWDGVFMYEIGYGVEPWTTLAAIAQRTSRVKLGTMLTPLPWRRPWKLASQVATLDQLSNGRAILAVGTGAVDAALGNTGEATDVQTRAARLDEGIDLIYGLWAGKLRFEGNHFNVDLEARRDDLARNLQPVQSRIPIWVVALWPRPRTLRRALRCDGLLPNASDENGWRALTPDDIRSIRQWLDDNGGVRPDFDIISEGETPADDRAAGAAKVAPWAEAGCTWWLETRWQIPPDADTNAVVRERINAGPPTP
jgi:alkanesulfonate monooxygenase SsuD/methylene tetrahydromethanopterin reductase-like flavin-dependent oxidoreductase (luciferase family)